jgi:hypothetical protein
MRKWTTALILICILIPRAALATIYYWVDDQGTQSYTTDLESIPEQYRSKAQPLDLPTSPPTPPERTPNPTPKGPIKIPFRPGSPVVVSAKINGSGPFSLILDTGADRTLVRLSALGQLGLSSENAAARVHLKGVTGESEAYAVWVNSVEVGDIVIGPLLIVAHDADLKGADGLLGRDFLGHFNVKFESKEGVVTLGSD